MLKTPAIPIMAETILATNVVYPNNLKAMCVIKKYNGGWGSETINASYTSENDFVGFASLSVCISSSQTL